MDQDEREGARRIIQKPRIDPIFSANWLDYQDKSNKRKTKSKDTQGKKKKKSTIENKMHLAFHLSKEKRMKVKFRESRGFKLKG